MVFKKIIIIIFVFGLFWKNKKFAARVQKIYTNNKIKNLDYSYMCSGRFEI